jgi:hypothetical protein
MRKILLTLAAVLSLLVVSATAAPDLRPEVQKKFESIVEKYKRQFAGADNQIQQSQARANRKNELVALEMGGNIENWIGTLDTIGTNGEGKAYIAIKLNGTITLSTWNNAFSDMDSNTLIEPNTQLYNTLGQMKKGARVKFSGILFQDSTDAYREQSITISGSMNDPEFLIRFTKISPNP